MVYMNLEGNWSLATPLTGLGCAKFMNILNKKITIRPQSGSQGLRLDPLGQSLHEGFF